MRKQIFLTIILFLLGDAFLFSSTSNPETLKSLDAREIIYQYGIGDQYIFEGIEGLLVSPETLIPSLNPEDSHQLTAHILGRNILIWDQGVEVKKFRDSRGEEMYRLEGRDGISAVVVTDRDGVQYLLVGPSLQVVMEFLIPFIKTLENPEE